MGPAVGAGTGTLSGVGVALMDVRRSLVTSVSTLYLAWPRWGAGPGTLSSGGVTVVDGRGIVVFSVYIVYFNLISLGSY